MTDYKRFMKFLNRYKIPYETGIIIGSRDNITDSDIICVGSNRYYFKNYNFEKCQLKVNSENSKLRS